MNSSVTPTSPPAKCCIEFTVTRYEFVVTLPIPVSEAATGGTALGADSECSFVLSCFDSAGAGAGVGAADGVGAAAGGALFAVAVGADGLLCASKSFKSFERGMSTVAEPRIAELEALSSRASK